MRAAILNGAVFLFMAHGEKLTSEKIWSRRWIYDNRYVIWPCAGLWNVRYKNIEKGQRTWLPIADKLFENEDEAWQASLEHLKHSNKNAAIY